VKDGRFLEEFMELLQSRALDPEPVGTEVVKFRVALETADQHPVKGEESKEKECRQWQIETEDSLYSPEVLPFHGDSSIPTKVS
jgi:hypothetical protein